jgi:hypothetical protein
MQNSFIECCFKSSTDPFWVPVLNTGIYAKDLARVIKDKFQIVTSEVFIAHPDTLKPYPGKRWIQPFEPVRIWLMPLGTKTATAWWKQTKKKKLGLANNNSCRRNLESIDMPFHVVRQGKTPGIYLTKSEMMRQVEGYKGSEYQTFASLSDATSYLKRGNSTMERQLMSLGSRARHPPSKSFAPTLREDYLGSSEEDTEKGTKKKYKEEDDAEEDDDEDEEDDDEDEEDDDEEDDEEDDKDSGDVGICDKGEDITDSNDSAIGSNDTNVKGTPLASQIGILDVVYTCIFDPISNIGYYVGDLYPNSRKSAKIIHKATIPSAQSPSKCELMSAYATLDFCASIPGYVDGSTLVRMYSTSTYATNAINEYAKSEAVFAGSNGHVMAAISKLIKHIKARAFWMSSTDALYKQVHAEVIAYRMEHVGHARRSP